MKLYRPGVGWYAQRIKENKPFTFIRYGDGEISAIINDGRRITGSHSHRLDVPKMKQQLRQSIIRRPNASNYFTAVRETALNRRFETWLIRNNRHTKWHDCTVFYKASRKGQLFPLIDAIRQSDLKLVMIGPPHLAKMQKHLPVAKFIPVPIRNCYKTIGQKIKLVIAESDEPLIVSISAGPPAKIMAWRLYKHVGEKSFIIDFGSLWDVYVGRPSRRYQRSMSGATIRKNLGDRDERR